MSIVQNPIIGRAKGQSGGVVFSTWYGRNVMRAKPFSYRVNNSEPAKKNKLRFKAGNELASKVKIFLNNHFKPLPTNLPIHNLTVSSVLAGVSVPSDQPVINPTEIVLGQGILLPSNPLSVQVSDVNELTVEWAASTCDPNGKPSDKVFIFVSDQNFENFKMFDTGVVRSTGMAVLDCSGCLDKKKVYVSQVSFISADNTLCSPFAMSYNGILYDLNSL